MMASSGAPADQSNEKAETTRGAEVYETLKYQLLGPSLTKAGQDAVDQQKVRAAREAGYVLKVKAEIAI